MEQNFLQMNDNDLIINIRLNQNYIGVLYERDRTYCIKSARKSYKNVDEDVIEDSFTLAVFDLYEKILKGIWVLPKDATLKSYLVGIVMNKVRDDFKRKKKENKYILSKSNFETDAGFDFDEKTVSQKEIELLKITKALEILKNMPGKCYSLIMLKLSYKRKISDLTVLFNSTYAAIVNKRKRCMKELKKIESRIILN